MTSKESFALNCDYARQTRISLGKNIDQFAEHLKVSRRTILNIERGKRSDNGRHIRQRVCRRILECYIRVFKFELDEDICDNTVRKLVDFANSSFIGDNIDNSTNELNRRQAVTRSLISGLYLTFGNGKPLPVISDYCGHKFGMPFDKFLSPDDVKNDLLIKCTYLHIDSERERLLLAALERGIEVRIAFMAKNSDAERDRIRHLKNFKGAGVIQHERDEALDKVVSFLQHYNTLHVYTFYDDLRNPVYLSKTDGYIGQYDSGGHTTRAGVHNHYRSGDYLRSEHRQLRTEMANVFRRVT